MDPLEQHFRLIIPIIRSIRTYLNPLVYDFVVILYLWGTKIKGLSLGDITIGLFYFFIGRDIQLCNQENYYVWLGLLSHGEESQFWRGLSELNKR
jgi:hypothetical protein